MIKSLSVMLPLALALLVVASCSPDRDFNEGMGGGPSAGTGNGGAAVMTSAGHGGSSSGSAGETVQAGANGIAGTSGAGGSGADGGGAGGGGGSVGIDCEPGQKRCDGACVAVDDPAYGCDPTLCDAARCPVVEGATLVCDSGECVIGECGAGSKQCSGACVSLTDPTYGCGATSCDAAACPSQGTGATLACEGGECVIGNCPANYKKCGDKCVAVSDPTYGCGASSCDATACPAAGSGTLVCQGGACVIGSCGAGTKKCGNKCVTTDANNGCAEASRCTACAGNEACSGSPSTCQCVPTAKSTACAGKCGSVPNGCGGTHTCGSCTSPQTCGGGGTANVCGCTNTAMATACSGKNCGTVPNGCGGTYTCGSCTSPQTCGGGGTANVCGCANTPMATACSGKSCGTAPNGCGGTYTCGSCSSSSAPVCVSNACKQCAVVNDCPSGSFACLNNTCVCRTPKNENLIKDGGFDTASTLNSWMPNDASWTNDDSDDCPGSGAVRLNGTIRKCFQVSADQVEYVLGLRYKDATGVGSGCLGLFYEDSSCVHGLGPAFLNLSASDPTDFWTSNSHTGVAPEGTRSIAVECNASGGGITIDQLYLRRPGALGTGF